MSVMQNRGWYTHKYTPGKNIIWLADETDDILISIS